MKRGFKLVERNYLKKWGEIDIILKKKGKIHFIEVKTVSCENISNVTHETLQEPERLLKKDVSHETLQEPKRLLKEGVSCETHQYRPEDNLHPRKLQRLGRTIQSYLLENDLEDSEWQLDAVIVYLDINSREAKVKIIENIII